MNDTVTFIETESHMIVVVQVYSQYCQQQLGEGNAMPSKPNPFESMASTDAEDIKGAPILSWTWKILKLTSWLTFIHSFVTGIIGYSVCFGASGQQIVIGFRIIHP